MEESDKNEKIQIYSKSSLIYSMLAEMFTWECIVFL
jgi:hypothetical protein